jgi:hypothetical protein
VQSGFTNSPCGIDFRIVKKLTSGSFVDDFQAEEIIIMNRTILELRLELMRIAERDDWIHGF